MEFCINKHTRQYFVYLDRERGGRLLLITPEGRISALKEDFFDGPFDGDENVLFSQSKVSSGQAERLDAYRRSKTEEAKLRLGTMIDHFRHIKLGEQQPHIEKLLAQVHLVQELEGGIN